MIITKQNFYVMTGGPGGGKSTLLHALHDNGYAYVDETARSIIKYRLSQGLSPRPAPIEFAAEMFQWDLKNYTDNLNTKSTIFFDRSFLDSAALLWEADHASFEKHREVLLTHRFNLKVFITPPWKEIFKNDAERDQTFEESVKVYERLFDWYSSNGYDLVVLPKATTAIRMEFVLNQIRQQQL